MPLIAALVASLGPSTLHFLGNEGCPDTAEVESQLRHIDPAAFDSAAQQLALIEVHPRGLRVRLFDGQGAVLEDRLLEGSRSCDEWAKAAAALLASWESEVGAPDLLLSSPLFGPPPAALDRELPRTRGPVVDAEVGIGPSGAIAGDGSAAVGGEIVFGLSPHAGAWGAQIGFDAATLRSVALAGGYAQWQRFAWSLGAYGTFGSGPLRVDLGAAVLVAVLSASGAGFLITQTASSVDPGLDLTFRLRWDFSRSWRLWVQAGPSFWLKAEHVQVLTVQTLSSATIPPLDLLATLGISYIFNL